MSYKFILLENKKILQNEVLEEILRERNYYYMQKKLYIDFWILINPKFSEKIEKKIQLIKEKKKEDFSFAIISSNTEFINWITLRLGDFLNISDELIPETTLNGIIGNIEKNEIDFMSKNYLFDQNIFLNKYTKIFKLSSNKIK